VGAAAFAARGGGIVGHTARHKKSRAAMAIEIGTMAAAAHEDREPAAIAGDPAMPGRSSNG